MSSRWTCVEIRPELRGMPPDEWAAACMEALGIRGCLGTEERGSGEDLRVLAWLPEEAETSGLQELLASEGLAGSVIAVRAVEDPGWVEQFNASLQPIDVGRRLTILPRPGPAPEGRVVLVIEPGRAFGTGHHESTRLALLHLEGQLAPGESVLDVGTGSGVLALAALKLGGSRAIGIDIDPEAIEVARENVEREPESARLRLMTCGDPSLVDGRFDVVLANIVFDTLVTMLPALRQKLAPGGRLILSGLLAADEEPMNRALAGCGLRAEWLREGEWVSACARVA